jgi:protein-disulfide isomerase
VDTSKLTNVTNALLVVCALVLTTLLVRRELFAPPSRQPSLGPSIQKDWQKYASSGHIMGRPDAPVTIVEFADFECPYCRQFGRDVDSLHSLGKNFKVVYRHFPLGIHRFALAAVRASECAADQGRFDTMHRALYTFSDSLGLAPWAWFARTAGVTDSAKFADCVSSHAPLAALARDTAAGNRLSITGTPVLLIGQLRTRGLPNFDSLAAYIDRASVAR